MLAFKSATIARSIFGKPAVAQLAVQRFMATTPDMKVEGEKARPVRH